MIKIALLLCTAVLFALGLKMMGVFSVEPVQEVFKLKPERTPRKSLNKEPVVYDATSLESKFSKVGRSLEKPKPGEFWKFATVPDSESTMDLPIFQTAKAVSNKFGDSERDYEYNLQQMVSRFGLGSAEVSRALVAWLKEDVGSATKWMNSQKSLAPFVGSMEAYAIEMAMKGNIDLAEKWISRIRGEAYQRSARVSLYASLVAMGQTVRVPDGIFDEVRLSDQID